MPDDSNHPIPSGTPHSPDFQRSAPQPIVYPTMQPGDILSALIAATQSSQASIQAVENLRSAIQDHQDTLFGLDNRSGLVQDLLNQRNSLQQLDAKLADIARKLENNDSRWNSSELEKHDKVKRHLLWIVGGIGAIVSVAVSEFVKYLFEIFKQSPPPAP